MEIHFTGCWILNFLWAGRLRWCSLYFLQQRRTIQKHFVGPHGDPSTHLKSSIYFRISSRFEFVDFNNISRPFQDHCSRTSWPSRTCTSVWACAMWTSMKDTSIPWSLWRRGTSHILSSWSTSACRLVVQSTSHFSAWTWCWKNLRRTSISRQKQKEKGRREKDFPFLWNFNILCFWLQYVWLLRTSMTGLVLALQTSGIVSTMTTSWMSRYDMTSAWRNKPAWDTSYFNTMPWEDFQWLNGVTSTSSTWKVKEHFIQWQVSTDFFTWSLLTNFTFKEPQISRFQATSCWILRGLGCELLWWLSHFFSFLCSSELLHWAQISSTILLRICKILLYQLDFKCPWLCNFFWWLIQDL